MRQPIPSRQHIKLVDLGSGGRGGKASTVGRRLVVEWLVVVGLHDALDLLVVEVDCRLEAATSKQSQTHSDWVSVENSIVGVPSSSSPEGHNRKRHMSCLIIIQRIGAWTGDNHSSTVLTMAGPEGEHRDRASKITFHEVGVV